MPGPSEQLPHQHVVYMAIKEAAIRRVGRWETARAPTHPQQCRCMREGPGWAVGSTLRSWAGGALGFPLPPSQATASADYRGQLGERGPVLESPKRVGIRQTDSRPRCLQMCSLNILRCKRSSALITPKAVLITRHFNTQSIEAFVNDFVNHLYFYSTREPHVWLREGDARRGAQAISPFAPPPPSAWGPCQELLGCLVGRPQSPGAVGMLPRGLSSKTHCLSTCAGLQPASGDPGISEAALGIPATQFSLSGGFFVIFFYLWSRSGFLGMEDGGERRKIHTTSAPANSFPVTHCRPSSIQVPLGGHPISRLAWQILGGVISSPES